MNYIKLAKLAWSNSWVLNPNVHVTRIDQIDYNKLKEMGIKYLIFDKDNTLTAHLEKNFYDSQIKDCVEKEIKKIYDSNTSVFIVSNSVKTQEKQQEVQQNLGLDLILTKQKKPDNFQEIMNHIKSKNPDCTVRNHEIAFFGDRLLTDVLLANSNGAISVYTNPFNNKNEHIGIGIMRKVESVIFQKFGNSRSINLYFLNKKISNFDQQILKQKKNE